MHPMIIQAVGAERNRELREQAAAWRRTQGIRHSLRPLARVRRAPRSLRVPAAA
jgi:hypothetical protein